MPLAANPCFRSKDDIQMHSVAVLCNSVEIFSCLPVPRPSSLLLLLETLVARPQTGC
jgi:hypothetical protein